MKKKVLVTGATGFIGNYVVQELLKKGFDIIATSSTAGKVALTEWHKKVTYISFNLDEFDNNINYFDLFQQPDMVIHLAWQGLPNYKADFHLTKNLPLHTIFLQNLLQNGLKDLTVTGTCFEYGMKEGCLTETMECEPGNPYAVAKNELRIELEKLTPDYNCNFKWVRLFYMYGKGQNPKSLISQLDTALEDGEKVFNMSGGQQVRDYLPVEQVAAYIVLIATQKKVTGIINCCSGIPVTVEQFVNDYLKSVHKNIQLNLGYYPYTDYEPMAFWGDNNKLKSILTRS